MLNFEIRKKYFAILTKKIADVYEIITGIPPLSLPNSKGKNLKSYSISGNVDEEIIEYSDGTAIEGKPNLLRTAGRTEQAVYGGSLTKRILQCDKWAKLTGNNYVSVTQSVTLGNGSVSFSTRSGGHGIGFPVKLKPNQRYTAYANVSATTTTATMNVRISFYAEDGTWVSWFSGNAVNSGMTLKSFAVPSNADMTVIVCALNTIEGVTTPTITFSDIMLVEGVYTTSNAPAYTPYKQLLTDCNGVGDKYEPYGYKIPVLSAGKNLFDISAYTLTKAKYINSTTGAVAAWGSGWSATLDYIPILANTQYTLSGAKTYGIATAGFALYDENKEYISGGGSNTNNPTTFTTPSNAKYIRISAIVQAMQVIQIEYGSTATEYEPYVAGTSNNIFINNSLFKISENVDIVNYPKNKITKAVGKYVFTGNENIELYDNSKGFRFAVSDMETGNCIDGYCNRFENFKNVTDNDVPRVFFGYNNNYVYFRRFSDTATTVEAIKATLSNWYNAGKPLTIWYPLEDEAEEAVTLPDIPTVRGNATIMIDTNVQPSEVTVEYAVEGA